MVSLVIFAMQPGLCKTDNINWMITLSVITLSGFYCSLTKGSIYVAKWANFSNLGFTTVKSISIKITSVNYSHKNVDDFLILKRKDHQNHQSLGRKK
jgi:hypothetical protein